MDLRILSPSLWCWARPRARTPLLVEKAARPGWMEEMAPLEEPWLGAAVEALLVAVVEMVVGRMVVLEVLSMLEQGRE